MIRVWVALVVGLVVLLALVTMGNPEPALPRCVHPQQMVRCQP